MNVFNYVYGFSLTNGIAGVVRADNFQDAMDRIQDKYGTPIKAIICLDELDDDYGVIGFNDINMSGDWWTVDLRSRKDGDTVSVIYLGHSHDRAWDIRKQWFEKNLPDWDDENDVMDLIDGSDGVFAYVCQLGRDELE